MKKGIIISIIAIAAMSGVVFLSQNSYFKNKVQHVNIPLFKKGEGYSANISLEKVNQWFKSNVYPRLNREVAERGEVAKEEIAKQKNEISKNAWEGTKEFIATKILQMLNVKPRDLENVEVPCTCSK